MEIKRTIAAALLAATLIGQGGFALAQDGSPVPPVNGGDALLQGLGLPEVTITVTATDATVTGDVPAGRVLLHVVNQIGAEVDLSVARVPDGVTDQDILDVQGVDTVPDWFFQSDFAGGVDVYPPATDGHAVVELTAGTWKFLVDRYAANEGDPEPADQIGTLTASGEAAPAEAVPGAVDITAYSYGFELPETINAGPQIWHFRNGGSQPHFFVLFGVPAGTTVDQLMQLVMFDPSSGTPIPAGGLQFEDVQPIGDGQVLSPDRSEWLGEELTPGSYALLCFIPDRVTGQFHAAMGMIKLFTVA